MEGPRFPDFPPTIPGLLAARTDDHECFVTPTGRLTYGELEEQSRRLAARLVGLGVVKGTRVGVLFPNSTPWVLCWAAATRIGAVVIPVNTFYAPGELGQFLRHADVQVLLTTDAFLRHDYLGNLEAVAPSIRDQRAPLRLPELPQLRVVATWGPAARPWVTGDLATATAATAATGSAAGTAAGDDAVVRGLEADVSPADPMVVIYTSGSTGEPKGVVHGHGAMVRHAANLAAMSDLGPAERSWTPLPLFWVGGLVFGLMRMMAVGATFLTQEVFEPGAALRFIAAERATTAGAWPGATKAMREHPDFAATDLTHLRHGTLLDRLPDPTLTPNSLGMTETGGPHTFYWAREEETGTPPKYRGAFGHPVPGVEHRIIDADTGHELPEGEEGEVLVRGYNLMLGMHRRERAEVFDADGWYHTGDRGLFRDGWFFFTGRQSDLIKTAGANVAPAEVEAALATFPEVKLAFVVGVAHPVREQDVAALIVPWAEGSVDVAGLRARLKEQVSAYKVPRHVVVIEDDDVPWLPSMKADRRALAALAAKLTASA